MQASSIFRVVAVVILLSLILLALILLWLRPPPPPPPDDDDDDAKIQAAWTSTGVLNTGLLLSQMCPEILSSSSASSCPSAWKCIVPDISDYNALINILSTKQDYVSCFSLPTSIQKQGLAQISFGPFGGQTGDVTVGLFLDLNVLGKYIACMWPFDSGSVGRYGKNRRADALSITPQQLTTKDGYAKLIQDCKNDDKCGLYEAGCAYSGGNPAKHGYFFADGAYTPDVHTPPDGGGPPEVPKGWVFPTGGLKAFAHPKDGDPDKDRAMGEFLQTVIDSQKILGAQSDPEEWGSTESSRCADAVPFSGVSPVPETQSCGDYWSYQFVGDTLGNGYRETELDIFVPQTPGAGGEDGDDEDLGNCGTAHPQFVEDFRRSILGVYATKFCANSLPLSKKSGASPCCSLDFSERLAVMMAEKYNSSAEVARLKLPHIKAYSWECADPSGKWQPDPADPRLRLTVISSS